MIAGADEMVADAVRRHTEQKGKMMDMTWSMEKYADFNSGTVMWKAFACLGSRLCEKKKVFFIAATAFAIGRHHLFFAYLST